MVPVAPDMYVYSCGHTVRRVPAAALHAHVHACLAYNTVNHLLSSVVRKMRRRVHGTCTTTHRRSTFGILSLDARWCRGRHDVGGWPWGTLDPASLLLAMLRGRCAGTPSCSSSGGHSYEPIRTPGRALQRTNPDHGFIQQRSLRRCLHGRPWIFVTAPIRPVPACIRGGARWHALSSAEK